jgi:hypothetical protein
MNLKKIIAGAALLVLGACSTEPKRITQTDVSVQVNECIKGQYKALQNVDAIPIFASMTFSHASKKCHKVAEYLRAMDTTGANQSVLAIRVPAETAFDHIGEGMGLISQGLRDGDDQIIDLGLEMYKLGTHELHEINDGLNGEQN